MGIVDDDLRQLAAVADALHAAGHRRHAGQHTRHVDQRMPLRPQRAGHAEQVGSVVVADEAGLHGDESVLIAALVQREGQTIAGVVQVASGQACIESLDTRGPQVQGGQLGRQRIALGIVQVDDRRVQAGEVEQRPLGRPVGGHVTVIVEMVLREIGEHGHANGAAGEPAFVEADAAGLDGAGRKTLVAHARKRGLQQHRVGRGQAVVVQPGRLADAQGPDHAAAPTQRCRGLGGPPGGRGLAVGAGDGDDRQRVGGPAEEGRSDLAGTRLQARQRSDTGIHEAETLDISVLYQAGGRACR